MEEFYGIISLLVACIELGLFVNLLIFSEKNSVNKSIILLTALFFIHQLLEFTFCFAGVDSSFLICVALLSFIFQPALALFVVARFNSITVKLLWLVFLPAVLFFFNYLFALGDISPAGCSFFNAQYNYPLDYLFLVFYFFPLGIMLGFLVIKIIDKVDSKKRKMNLTILTGYGAAFLIGLIILTFVPGAADSYEGIFSKLSLLPAFAFAAFAFKNRINIKSEKE